ncbi:MAG: hypothetical protein GY859_05315, partial [Desulfobacterales bacterium]|nr:hypothetical protein [Desulfobacterales bacterium]
FGEWGEDGAITDLQLLKTFTDLMGDLTFPAGRRFRVAAEDLAGNKTTRIAERIEEILLLNAWSWDPDALRIPFRKNNLGEFIPHFTKGAVSRTLLELNQNNLRILETIHAPLTRVNLQFGQFFFPWVQGPALDETVEGVGLVRWDSSGVNMNMYNLVRLEAVDESGAIHNSNIVILYMDFILQVDCHGAYGENSLPVELRILIFQYREINGKYWKTYKVLDTDQGDAIPAGRFEAPLPDLPESSPAVFLRMVGVDRDDASFNTPGDEKYPAEHCVSLSLDIEYERAEACNTLSPGVARLSVEIPENIPLSSITHLDYCIRPKNDPGDHVCFQRLQGPDVGPGGDFRLDVSDMAEGEYEIKAVLAFQQMEKNLEASAVKTLFVDRTLPGAAFTSPAASSWVCPDSQMDPNGIVSRSLGVHGEATDDLKEGVHALFHGAGADPVSWRAAKSAGSGEPLEGKGVISGPLGVWDVTGLEASADSACSLMLKVYDAAGNLRCAETSFFMDPDFTVSRRFQRGLISPNGDGRSDHFTAEYNIEKEAWVDLTVTDAGGGTTRTLATGAHHAVGPGVVAWDGLDDAGAAAPEGEYTIEILAEDACGQKAGAEIAKVIVDLTPPLVEITHPAPGDPSSVVIEVTGTAEDLHFHGYTLEAFDDAGPAGPAIPGSAPVRDGVLGAWSAFAREGRHTLTLTAEDLAGNRASTSVEIQLGPRSDLITHLN